MGITRAQIKAEKTILYIVCWNLVRIGYIAMLHPENEEETVEETVEVVSWVFEP